MLRYLLDTNAVSHLADEPEGRVAQRLLHIGTDRACTSIIVAAELRYGIAKKGSLRLKQRLDAALASIRVMPFEHPADSTYADIRLDLERRGRPISANDLLIAAHALTLGCTLVTANKREFSRIKALMCENWLR